MNLKLVIAVLLYCLTTSCAFQASTTTRHLSSYEKSLRKWKKLKKRHQNIYSYSIHDEIYWTGYQSETIISVHKGVVTRRVLSEFNPVIAANFKDLHFKTIYIENKEEINTHSRGNKGQTLDEVYLRCKTYLAVSPTENDIYFSVDSNGIINTCGYNIKNCEDGCNEGIRIQKIRFK